jgi:benzoyl-CoA reductase/2-hydroxyglutaryl-CoA dehydratase subunit BcrC/BadD/HgdB
MSDKNFIKLNGTLYNINYVKSVKCKPNGCLTLATFTIANTESGDVNDIIEQEYEYTDEIKFYNIEEYLDTCAKNNLNGHYEKF